jgi:hypothetical protein
MRERQRVEVLRDRIAAQNLLSTDESIATIAADPETRLMEPA